ncbi:hypothetical protein EJ08DRAFT_655551 [Tothia fuscella]|uniref:Uncharacterized protein n=1 Tax=Tothia fuscella TaxID=1048955 RepID=A0A9P4U437_9PEZI|nr:hypothetical protein EJ08DRAFT_655551 [Tothia fuscella]
MDDDSKRMPPPPIPPPKPKDTLSPKTRVQDGVPEVPDSQDTEMEGREPREARRPSIEPLDKAEAAREVARLLKDMRPYPTKPTTTAPRPPLRPFSSKTNPDAIALRASLSLLQTQKARAASDMVALQTIKQVAMADPEGFIKGITSGEVSAGTWGEGVPAMPKPQDIVRMPPINWAKYGVVGESLDKLHEEQRERPTLGQPEQLQRRTDQPKTPLADMGYSGERAEKAYLAAPYNPLSEKPLGKR